MQGDLHFFGFIHKNARFWSFLAFFSSKQIAVVPPLLESEEYVCNYINITHTMTNKIRNELEKQKNPRFSDLTERKAMKF